MVEDDLERERLGRKLLKEGVKLYGTSSCASCRAQKTMLYRLNPLHWRRIFVDCDLLSNALEAGCIEKIPTWKIGGRLYEGVHSEAALKKLLLLQRQNGEHTRRHRRRSKWAKREYGVLLELSLMSDESE